MPKYKLLPNPSVRRLPLYLSLAQQADKEGLTLISATVLAEALDLDAIQVRKDIAITGIVGKPKLGYRVKDLITSIENFLNWNKEHKAIVVGAGNLGSALLGYQGFKNHGLHFVAAFDSSEAIINKAIHDIPIFHIDSLKNFIRSNPDVEIAVLAVPPVAAQSCAEILEKAGIKSIWNFTTIRLKVSADIIVQNEDLLSGYALLSACMRTRKNNHQQ